MPMDIFRRQQPNISGWPTSIRHSTFRFRTQRRLTVRRNDNLEAIPYGGLCCRSHYFLAAFAYDKPGIMEVGKKQSALADRFCGICGYGERLPGAAWHL